MLEAECDQSRFFKQYSSVNNKLEERFVDLLLLSNSAEVEMELKLERSGLLDLSGVIKAIENIPSLKSSGM